MRAICDYCGKEVDVLLYQAKDTYKVKGEDITIDVTICKCSCCGEDIWVSDVDNNNLRTAYNEYRKKHQLLTPDQIKGIREKYGLSQVSFAKLLGFGEKTIARYENGSIQDEAHNNLMMLVDEPQNLKKLYDRKKYCIPMMEQFSVNARMYTNAQNIAYSRGKPSYQIRLSSSEKTEQYDDMEVYA